MVDFIHETPLSLKDVAARFGVTTKTVRQWIGGVRGRRLEAFRMGGKLLVTVEALQRFAAVEEPVQYARPSAVARDNAETMRLLRERHG